MQKIRITNNSSNIVHKIVSAKKINKLYTETNSQKISFQTKNILDCDELLIGMKQAIDVIAKTKNGYIDRDGNLTKFTDVKPGFLKSKLPDKPPQKAEPLSKIIEDTEKLVIPGILDWQKPNFHGFFPASVAHQVLVAEAIGSAFYSPGFTWYASPVNTELENLVVDWAVHLLNLPHKFLLKNEGGGMLGNSIGDDIYLGVIAAKHKKLKELDISNLDSDKTSKFVGYYTAHSHMQMFKALYLKDINHVRELPVEFDSELGNYKLKESFVDIIEEDVKNGLIPFFFGSTIGTTSSGAIDDINKISEICLKHNIFLLTDCAWAGPFFCIDKYKEIAASLKNANAVCVNFCKTMLCGPGTAGFFIDDKLLLTEALAGKNSKVNPDPEYLKNQYTDEHDIIDYKDWQIGLSRKFSSIKVWYVMRSYGVQGIQKVLQNAIEATTRLTELIEKDERFEIHTKQSFSLVSLRVKMFKGKNLVDKEDKNKITEEVVNTANKSLDIFISGSRTNGNYYIRCSFIPTYDQEHENADFLYKTLIQSLEYNEKRELHRI